MPVLNGRRFSELDPGRVGVFGAMALLLLVVGALRVGPIRDALTGSTYAADFAQAAGLRAGNDVRVSGLTVGRVDGVALEGTHVRVTFTVRGVSPGAESTAAIKTANAVGSRFLSLTPLGTGHLGTIPVARTSVPYSLTGALSDLTRTAQRIDVPQLVRAMNAVSDTFAGTPQAVTGTLRGLGELSAAVASRNGALSDLLHHADGVSRVLAQRSQQITGLMRDGDLVLQELVKRRVTIHALLVDIQAAGRQLSGVIRDNDARLAPALSRIDRVVALLQDNERALDFVLGHLGGFTRNLGEAVGGGPFFYGYVQNITPTNLVPVPGTDAAGGTR